VKAVAFDVVDETCELVAYAERRKLLLRQRDPLGRRLRLNDVDVWPDRPGANVQ